MGPLLKIDYALAKARKKVSKPRLSGYIKLDAPKNRRPVKLGEVGQVLADASAPIIDNKIRRTRGR